MGYGIKQLKGKSDSMILKKVSINGNVCGGYAEVSVNQIYENTSKDNIEAVYMFPIPNKAIISGFEVVIGGRTLKAIVEEKKKAFKIVESANERGDTTLFLEEFKPHVFRISIGKIISGEKVNIKLSYIDELEYKNKSYKLLIPAVLEPKNIAFLEKYESKIGFINRIHKDQQEDFEFTTNIFVESLCKLKFKSLNHKIKVETQGDRKARINLNADYESMDKDFILLMEEVNPEEYSGMIYEYKHKGEDRGLIYLRAIPNLQRFEKEESEKYIFLIDISDTMDGDKLEEAKSALQLCIRNLEEDDFFNIIAMGKNLKYFSKEDLLPFTPNTLREASNWINNLQSEEDADIFGAIKYSLSQSSESTILIFTDDQVEEEDEILEYVEKNLRDNRIFSFGIDSAANNYFLNKLAHLSLGKAEFINNSKRIEEIVLKQFNRIKNPQIDDVKINWGNLKVKSTYPRTIDYIYGGEAFSIFALFSQKISGNISIEGKVGTEDYKSIINLDNFNDEKNISMLRKIWARKRIRSIEMNMRAERGDTKEAMKNKIIELSKNAGIISSETTFIFMELRDEPVLGIQLKNIIPLTVNETTIADELYGDELEDGGFLYKVENKIIDDTSFLDYKYPREKLLKIIAKNQFANGSFIDFEDSNLEDKIETTAMALLAFTIGKEDISIYLNQLNKSIEFICRNIFSESIKLDSKLINILILTLANVKNKEIVKYKYIDSLKNAEKYLYSLLNPEEGISNDFNDGSFKRSLISIFNVGADGKSISENIVIREESNSIFSLSKLAILKGIKN